MFFSGYNPNSLLCKYVNRISNSSILFLAYGKPAARESATADFNIVDGFVVCKI